jgi:hypothetical protein
MRGRSVNVPPPFDETGQQSTPEHLMWRKLAEDLQPDKVLDRIDTRVTFIFGSVALVGTILAGLGITSGSTSRLAPYKSLLTLALILVAIALGLAMISMLPSLRRVNPGNIFDVERFYTHRIQYRGWLARLALTAFSGALLVSLALALVAAALPPKPTISLQWAAGAGKSGVTASVKGTNFEEGSVVEATVTAVASAKSPTVLAHALATIGASGALDIQMTMEGPRDEPLHLSITTSRHGKSHESQTLDLTP